jgi:hypothetical protein
MRYALTANSTVSAIIMWDGESPYTPPEGMTLVLEPEGQRWQSGWAMVDGVAVPPEEPRPEVVVPAVVTMRQARLALLAAGHLQDLAAAIEALPSPQKEAAQIEWEYAATIERVSPLTALLAAAVNLDAQQLDALFTSASQL